MAAQTQQRALRIDKRVPQEVLDVLNTIDWGRIPPDNHRQLAQELDTVIALKGLPRK